MCACAITYTRSRRGQHIIPRIFLWALPQKRKKDEWNKWKNHFYEMKGDVGMSHHEKEREQEDAYTKTESHS